jgi:hypothetical protein
MIAGELDAGHKPVHEALSPWTGFAMMCLYTAVTLCVGSWVWPAAMH